ncbi:hypothetical protein GCM10010199_70980 [Dactylosporangium roseum]
MAVGGSVNEGVLGRGEVDGGLVALGEYVEGGEQPPADEHGGDGVGAEVLQGVDGPVVARALVSMSCQGIPAWDSAVRVLMVTAAAPVPQVA